jgi:hypothetical protein
MSVVFRILLVIVATSCVMVSASNAKPRIAKSNQLCGVILPPSVEAVKTKVERFDRTQIDCKVTYLIGAEGKANREKGKLEILVDAGTGRNSANIAHELLHLELDQLGWPKLPQPSIMLSADGLARYVVKLQLIDIISHIAYVFPHMKLMGFDPSTDFLAQVRYSVTHRDVPPGMREFPQIFAVLDIQVRDADRDLELQNRLQLATRGLDAVALSGEQCDELLQKNRPIVASKVKRLTDECSDLIWKNLPVMTMPKDRIMSREIAGQY